MAIRKDRTFLLQFHTLFNLGSIRHLTDGQLLERFADGHGEAAELAFAALVERHAALVLRVCRARLGDSHDAQDAFQATFLVLVKKARTLWVQDSIGPWLHQVAFRTASCARSSDARRRRLERNAAIVEASQVPDGDGWERALHEEVDRLPVRYRVPIVLCDLQGHSCEEAARRMGRPVGTVKSWRSRGRDRLRQRLTRLGLAPAALLAGSLARAQAAISKEAVAHAVRKITNSMTDGTVPASVSGLVNGVLKAMLLSKLRIISAALVACVALASGLGAFSRIVAQDTPKIVAPVAPPVNAPDDVWPLTRREAVRIGLTNSRAIRVMKPEAGTDSAGPLRIVSKAPNIDGYRFKSEVLAHVRSVEQQYWALQLGQVQYWASETAVDITEQIVARELAKLLVGSRNGDSLKEAQEQLERFRLDLVDKTANLINTERQLRNILGLPQADARRIVPVTNAREDWVETNWEESRKVMLDQQPDLLRASAIVEAAGAGDVDRLATIRREIQHQAEHSLARFFLEVDSNYKLFQTAGRLKQAARQRLDAQRDLYEIGKITIDRYLDAVNRWATATSQAADFRARYNSAIAALEEAKGSLLDRDGVVIAEAPRIVEPAAPARDGAVESASFVEPRTPGRSPSPSKPKADRSGTTYSFKLKLGVGPKPVEISGSFSVAPTEGPIER